jgi:ATP-binding cassette subfamily F protein 3
MLIGLQNVTFEFGARVIVEDATWHINPGERIGLIGYNGTGKSTLFKVLVGEYMPSKGSVEKGRETTIGYLHQDLLSFDTNDSILEVALSAFEKVKSIEKEIEEITAKLEIDSSDELLLLYSEKLHDLEVAGGYEIEYKTEEVLHGLGFSDKDIKRPYKEFSGGWRMRVLLAKMILQQPDVLLLDEPTNHLDLPSIEWLERYLLFYKGSVVIVSHDKFFLNRMVNKIVELYQQELHIYSGNYEFYEQEKAIRVELQQKAYENQQDYIRQQERFVERFKAKASKAAAAQSIVKRLDKIERIEQTEIERPNIKINFRIDKQPGKIISELKNVSKRFGEIEILNNASIEINRGDKIALVGANGKGKSTVLRIVSGTENVIGERVPGHNVEESFYAQHQLEALNISNTILEEMQLCGSNKTDLELRSLLGCFLFSGDDADKKIRVLSGGEKARVALAKVIAGKSNFLLLDEPTNHLDMHSVELLAEALSKYEGSYLLVSHDRYFISMAANKIWEIEDGIIKEFKGTYAEWTQWKESEANNLKLQGAKAKAESPSPSISTKVEKEKPETIASTQQNNNAKTQNPNNQFSKELQKLKRTFEKLEGDIANLNTKKATIENDLGNPDNYADRTKFVALETSYNTVKTELATANKQYEELFEKIMELEG